MKRIMVVDDEKDLREMIDQLLQIQGYETETAVNGEDFLQKVDEFDPDIITLDIMMPGLTTKEILEKLKGKQTQAKIVLVSVVRFSEEQKKQIFQMGNIVDYITKPFEIDDLMDVLKQYV
jgi:two-component system, OmpR family, alkaline phosphatase synthesis response regulator PhoP